MKINGASTLTTRSPGTAGMSGFRSESTQIWACVDGASPDRGTGTRTAVCGLDVRAISRPRDTAMPMMRPGRVSKRRTPSNVAAAAKKSTRAVTRYTLASRPVRTRHSR